MTTNSVLKELYVFCKLKEQEVTSSLHNFVRARSEAERKKTRKSEQEAIKAFGKLTVQEQAILRQFYGT